nr:MAG TPA: hypothetical protein [Caudoviricetes sp.]
MMIWKSEQDRSRSYFYTKKLRKSEVYEENG